MDGLQARLDRAITEARELLLGVAAEWGECPGEPECGPGAHLPHLERWLDKYTALVALREWYVVRPRDCALNACDIRRDKDAEAERLLGSGEDA